MIQQMILRIHKSKLITIQIQMTKCRTMLTLLQIKRVMINKTPLTAKQSMGKMVTQTTNLTTAKIAVLIRQARTPKMQVHRTVIATLKTMIANLKIVMTKGQMQTLIQLM